MEPAAAQRLDGNFKGCVLYYGIIRRTQADEMPKSSNMSLYFYASVLFCLCVCAGPVVDPRKVLIIAGHHNWIVAAYAHFVICYR